MYSNFAYKINRVMGSAEDEIGDGGAKYAKLRPMSLKRLKVED